MNRIATYRRGASQATLIRQIVMVVVLLVVVGAAVYDFQVARPAAKAAYDTIMAKADEHIRSSKPPLSAADVQEVLKRKPSYSEKGPNKYVEKYSWISGLPWRSYYIWVIYTPGETPYFEDILLNEELPETARPHYQPPPPPQVAMPSEPVGVGGPGAGARQGPPAGADSRPQRPESEKADQAPGQTDTPKASTDDTNPPN